MCAVKLRIYIYIYKINGLVKQSTVISNIIIIIEFRECPRLTRKYNNNNNNNIVENILSITYKKILNR